MLSKRDIVASLIAGEVTSWFVILVIKNPHIEEFKQLAEMGQLVWSLLIVLPIIFLIGIVVAEVLGKISRIFQQIIRFGETGVLNTVIDLGILGLLMAVTGIGVGIFYAVFKGVSFIIAAINSYFWNKLWTFQKEEFTQTGKELVQFLVVSIIGFGVNVGAAYAVVNAVGPQFGFSEQLWGMLGGAAAVLCSMVWNFLGYKFIVFKK